MVFANMLEAGTDLPSLIDRAVHGEQVLIGQDGKAMVQLVPVPFLDRTPRRPGGWEGKVRMSDDFDELPEELRAYFNGEKS